MRREVILLMGAAIADVSPRQDQRWPLIVGLGFPNSRRHVLGVVAIRNHASVPATRLEAFSHVLGKIDFGRASEGNVILVVQINEFAQTQVSSQRGSFLA